MTGSIDYEVGSIIKYKGLVMELEARWVLRDGKTGLEVEDAPMLGVDELDRMQTIADMILEDWVSD